MTSFFPDWELDELPSTFPDPPFPYSAKYYQYVIATLPIAYWPLWEETGTIAWSYPDPNLNGTYKYDISTFTGDGIGDGNNAPAFDGTQYVNLYTPTLVSKFNPLKGSLGGWAKNTWDVWSDGVQRYAFNIGANGDNAVNIAKYSTAQYWKMTYAAGAVAVRCQELFSSTAWFHWLITWDAENDTVQYYVNGEVFTTEEYNLGTWVGAIHSTLCVIGAYNTSTTSPYIGSLAHIGLWDKVITPTQAKTLAQPTFLGDLDAVTITDGPVLLLSFDDHSDSAYTYGYSAMRGLRMKGTVYHMGATLAGRQGNNDVLYAADWDIANHSWDSVAFNTLNQAQIETKLQDAIDELTSYGYNRAKYHVAYPGGYYNDDTFLAMAAVNALTGRTTLLGVDNVIPLADNYLISCDITLGVSTSLQDAKDWVDYVIANEIVGFAFGHHLVETPTLETQWGIENYHALIEYIAGKDLPVLTITELYELSTNGSVTVEKPYIVE